SGHEHIDLERNQFGRKRGEALRLPLGISVFDHDMAALDAAEVTQPLEEGLVPVGPSGPVERQVAYPGNLARWLRVRGERRGEEAAGHAVDEAPSIQGSPSH